MESTTCSSCGETTYENSKFCHNCGTRLLCVACGYPLVKNAKNCIECGKAVEKTEVSPNNNLVNTIRYERTQDKISCDVTLTNEVGKEGIAELIATISNSNKNYTNENLLNGAISKTNRKNPEENGIEDIDYKEEITEETEEENSIHNNLNENSNHTTEFLHLSDLGMTLECNESEWILIYCFYESEFNKKPFNKDLVYKLYLDNRGNDNRRKNFARNWKANFQAGYVSTLKENEFKFQSKGLEFVKSLINSTNEDPGANSLKNGKKKTKNQDSKRSSKITPAKQIIVEEFDILKNDTKTSLEDFIKSKNPGNNSSYRILVIGYYITKINCQSHFTDGNIEFAYRALGLNNRPKFLHQIIINLKNNQRWIEKAEGTLGWELTRIGEIFVDEKLPIKE